MHPLVFNTRDELIKIDLDRMVYAEANGNYTDIMLMNGQKVEVSLSLMDFEGLILASYKDSGTNRFIRIGRKYIVDMEYIVCLNIPKQTLTLSDQYMIRPMNITVAKEALKNLKKKLTEGMTAGEAVSDK